MGENLEKTELVIEGQVNQQIGLVSLVCFPPLHPPLSSLLPTYLRSICNRD